jgi:hypothetical protein
MKEIPSQASGANTPRVAGDGANNVLFDQALSRVDYEYDPGKKLSAYVSP